MKMKEIGDKIYCMNGKLHWLLFVDCSWILGRVEGFHGGGRSHGHEICFLRALLQGSRYRA